MSLPTRVQNLAPVAPNSLAVCTIVAKNHMPRARVLYNSLRHYHPDIPFFVLLADRVDGEFDPTAEPFQVILLDQLSIPYFESFCFRYTLFELTCAAKPYLLEYLAADLGFQRLVYFDSDIFVLGNLAPLFAQLDKHSILLTPHLTAPLADDGKTPGEMDMLQVGIFNGGFVGVKYDQVGRDFVSWWRDRLYDKGQVDLAQGLFVDQKWLNLVPGLFPHVNIMREPGYNVAYWNLYSRTVELREGGTCVNGEPGYFFHFSGFDPAVPYLVSKHTTRLNQKYDGPAAPLYHRYAELVNAAGEAEAREWQYGYGSFNNGVPIPPTARAMYTALGKGANRFPHPFATNDADSFFHWLNEPVTQDAGVSNPISRLWYTIYQERAELRDAFPDVLGKDRAGFIEWTIQHGVYEREIPARYLAPLLQQNNRTRHAARETNKQTSAALPFGVNLVGNFRSEKGVGEAVRGGLANLQAVKVAHALVNFDDILALNTDSGLTQGMEPFSETNPYRFNLVWLNADTIERFVRSRDTGTIRGADFFKGHTNLAHWAWEVQDFPAQWATSFDWFDEIWVASRFIQEGMARVSPVPVRAVPYSVTLPSSNKPAPALVGFPQGRFVFLFIFDLASYAARKNPRGVIQAFRRAFRKDDEALLVLKIAHSAADPAGLAEMQKAAQDANILITDAVLGREQVGTLLDAADCYVSLHRAEGFGLTMAEAMLRGKPVIATGYSGNLDFMNAANSYLVRYRLTSIGHPYGPYQKDFVWAEPDVDHAAELMRYVYEHRDAARAVGEQARKDVGAQLNPQAVGKLMEGYLIKT